MVETRNLRLVFACVLGIVTAWIAPASAQPAPPPDSPVAPPVAPSDAPPVPPPPGDSPPPPTAPLTTPTMTPTSPPPPLPAIPVAQPTPEERLRALQIKENNERLARLADPNRSPFHLNIIADAGISVGAMVLIGVPRLLQNETARPWCGLQCNPKDVNAFDRTVIGHESKVALQVSNAGFGTNMTLPFVVSTIDALTSKPADGFVGSLKDDLIMIETLSITLTTNNLLSFIVRRPRPHTYDTKLSDAERLKPDNSFSFPSGHTSASFAMATAYSRIYMLRHPKSPAVIPLWIGSYSMAAATGILRPLAGDHFWTDVIVGACTGIGLGLLVPWIHLPDKTNNGRDVAWNPSPTALDFHFAPLPIDHGAGLFVFVE